MMNNLFCLKPEATSAELSKLLIAHKTDTNVCQQIAQHPNTSPAILKELFKKYPLEVLNNPVLDLILLETPNFYEELYESNLFCFEDFKLPLFYLEWAINSSNYRMRRSIARTSITPLSVLEKLATDKHYLVRSSLANNSYISKKIIEILIKDRSINVLEYLAANSQTTSDFLAKLSKHQDKTVRANVAKNYNISLETGKQLMKDSEKEVQAALASNRKIPNLILHELFERAIEGNYDYKIMTNIVGNSNATFNLRVKAYKICKRKFEVSPKTFHFPAINYFTNIEIIRVNWTKDKAINHLSSNYGKKSRMYLSERESTEFYRYLVSLPTANANYLH